MNDRQRWDLDLREGLLNEQALARILKSDTFEIKKERMGTETGNHLLEFECNGKPSGISVTQAETWAVSYGTPTQHMLIPINFMKDIGRWFYYTAGIVSGGDGDRMRGILIPWNAFNPQQQVEYYLNFDLSLLKVKRLNRMECPF